MKKTCCIWLLVLLLALFAGCKTGEKPAETAVPTLPQTETGESSEQTNPPETAGEQTNPPETAGEQTNPPETAGEQTTGVTPMLFHVTDANGHEMYLFGTIHAGDKRMNEAMDRIVPFVDGCDALAVEFDIVAYEKDTKAQMQDLMQFVYKDGTTVDQHMPAELFERASALLNEAKLMPNLMKSYNLAMWSQLVDQAAMLLTSDLDFENGMDRRLIRYCYDKAIEVRDVESAELQYGLLAGFSDELNLLLIENTLDHLDEYGENLSRLFEIWTRGDYNEILAFLEAEDEDLELTEEQTALLEDYNDIMLTQRNLGMRDKAVEWLETGDKVFFAVGAAHLVGENGLVELLRTAGCTVEQVEYR